MTHALRVFVPGVPASQGSLKAFVVKGRPRITHDNKGLGVWRDAVTRHAAELWGGQAPLDGAVAVTMTFYLPRPPSIPRRQRYPHRRPDLDKLARAVLDSLTGLVLSDDARAVDLVCAKRYAVDEPPGVALDVVDLGGAGAS